MLSVLCITAACLAGCGNQTDRKKEAPVSDEAIVKDIDLSVRNIERSSLTEVEKSYHSDNDGGNYKGYFDGKTLLKFVHERKNTLNTQNGSYYFRNGELAFVHITENRQKCKGEMTCAWELKHYYHNGHLFKSFKRGDVFAPGIPFDLETRSFVPNTEDNLAAEDTIQQHFAGYVRSLLTSP